MMVAGYKILCNQLLHECWDRARIFLVSQPELAPYTWPWEDDFHGFRHNFNPCRKDLGHCGR